MLIKSDSRHMHPLKRNFYVTENLGSFPNNVFPFQSEICMISKKKNPKNNTDSMLL